MCVTVQALETELRRRIEREASDLKPTRLTLDTVSWGDGPDAGKFWIPEDLAPLWSTPAYDDLTPQQRLRYNHYFALQMAEEFIWLERYLIIAALTNLVRGEVPTPSLRTLLESFVTDEQHHNASLYRLLELARPDIYENSPFYFFVPPRNVSFLIGVMARLPRLLSAWGLFAGTLEEQTILISRRYRDGNEDIDPVFASVYILHAQDEARHCKLDSMIADWLMTGQHGWAEQVNAKVLGIAFQAYYSVDWGYDRPIRRLVADFPDLRDREAGMIRQAMSARSATYTDSLLDRSTSPITTRNAERYEMLDRAIRRLAP